MIVISAPLLWEPLRNSHCTLSLYQDALCFIFQTLFLTASVYPALGCHIFETILGVGVVWKAAGTCSQLMQTPSMTVHPVAAPAMCSCECSFTHILFIQSMFSLHNNGNQHRISTKFKEVRVREQLAPYANVGLTGSAKRLKIATRVTHEAQYCQINSFTLFFLKQKKKPKNPNKNQTKLKTTQKNKKQAVQDYCFNPIKGMVILLCNRISSKYFFT